MTLEEFKKQYSEDDTLGWKAIDEQLATIYGEIEPRHYGPLCGLHFIAGGTDPIDGVSIYDTKNQEFHRHLVSYGMSELYYDEEKVGNDFSKWGFEFTMRLAPFHEDKGDPIWAIQIMNNLARYVYSSGNWFEENHFVSAKGPIRLNTQTEITALIFTIDPELGKINTPYGEVTFLQIVGITAEEEKALGEAPTVGQIEDLVAKIKESNPLLITDLNRK
jgi:hypothetical protein